MLVSGIDQKGSFLPLVLQRAELSLEGKATASKCGIWTIWETSHGVLGKDFKDICTTILLRFR